MASTGSQSEIEVLEDEDGPPTEEQVLEYAEYLGMDLESERHLLWIAREGISAPVPHPWKTCTEKGEVFYFNFETEESSWDHPCDGQYRKLLEEHRKEKKDTKEHADEKEKSLPAQDKKPGPAGEMDGKDDDGDVSFVSEMVGSDSEASSRKAINSEAAWSDSSARSSPHSAHSSSERGNKKALAGESSSDKAATEPVPIIVTAPTEVNSTVASKSPQTLTVASASRGIGLGGLKEDSKGLELEPPSSNISEVSEDFRSDWGAPSPLGSGAGGLSREAQSLEVSTSGDAGSLSGAASILMDKPQTSSSSGAVQNWASLHADLASLQEVLASAAKLRQQQASLLGRLKS